MTEQCSVLGRGSGLAQVCSTIRSTAQPVAIFNRLEFLLLGAVAGIMGSLLANGFASLLLKRLLNAEASFQVVPSVVCVLITALIANAAGWMASFRILGRKPLEILRDE